MTNEEIIQTCHEIVRLIQDNNMSDLTDKLNSLEDPKSLLNTVIPNYESMLICALTCKNFAVLKIFIEFGIDVNIKDGLGLRPLDHIVRCLDGANNEQDFQTFLDCGLYMNEQNMKRKPFSNNINQFNIYLLRLQHYREYISKVYGHFYKHCLEAIDTSQKLLNLLTEKYGASLLLIPEEVVRAGSVLGIETHATIKFGESELEIDSAENQTPFTKSYLYAALQEYAHKKLRLKPPLRSALDQITTALEGNNPDLKIIVTGWKDHELYVAILKDKFILCNRGEGHSVLSRGVKIFTLKKNANYDNFAKRFSTAKDFEDELISVIDTRSYPKTFGEIKKQRHATCTFVNAKSMIVPLLSLLGIDNAYNEYKKFTAWLRDREVDHLLLGLMQAKIKRDNLLGKMYFKILSKYLLKQFIREKETGETRKNDVERCNKIFEVFGSIKQGRKFLLKLGASNFEDIYDEDIELMLDEDSRKSDYTPSILQDRESFKCADPKLRRAILDNFKERELHITAMVELAKCKSLANEDLIAALDQEILELEQDWREFIAANDKNIVHVAEQYVVRRNSWIISSVFNSSEETPSLEAIASACRPS